MDNDAFRAWSDKAADWGVDYRASLRNMPVRAQTQPGDTFNAVPEAAPESAEPMETIFADFERIILPGITHWQHPRSFACFPANAQGLAYNKQLRVYCSEQVHTSIDWAIWVPGIGAANLVRITGVGPMRSMNPAALEAAIDAHNQALIIRINIDGRIYLTQTKVDGAFAIRFQAGSWHMEKTDAHMVYGVITPVQAEAHAPSTD